MNELKRMTTTCRKQSWMNDYNILKRDDESSHDCELGGENESSSSSSSPKRMIRHLEGFLFQQINSVDRMERTVKENEILRHENSQLKDENELLKQRIEELLIEVQNMKQKTDTSSGNNDSVTPTKKRKQDSLVSPVDANRDDLQLLCDAIHKITDDDASSLSSTTTTTTTTLPSKVNEIKLEDDNQSFIIPFQHITNDDDQQQQQLQEMNYTDESYKDSKPAEITPIKIPSSVQQQEEKEDDDDFGVPKAHQEYKNKNKCKEDNHVISTTKTNINKTRQKLRLRVKYYNEQLKIEEVTQGDLLSTHLLQKTNHDEDSFRKQLHNDTIKVYRIRMFRNDARCDRDPMGNLPSKWGIQHGYVACEARILPSHVNTPKDIRHFCSSTFPINATSASCAKDKLTTLFHTSPSWR